MKKIGIICLIAIIALGVIGAGYAAWSQTLTVSTTLNVATFDVHFTAETAPTAPSGGTATIVRSGADHTETIAVTKAYPGWSGDFTFTVSNAGEVPVTVAMVRTGTDTLSLLGDPSPTGDQSVAAGATKVYTVHAAIPAWTGTSNQGATATATYTFTATQNTP